MNTHIYHIEDDHIYTDLHRALSSRRLILFAGSGLSAQAATADGRHPPLWKELLKGMVDWCVYRHWIETQYAQDIRELIDEGFLIDAGEELQGTLEPPHLQQCLRGVLLCNEASPHEAHRLIVRLDFPVYLTTNYDEFIEGAFWVEKGVSLRKFYEHTIAGVLAAYREETPLIIKLHGDIAHPSSIVLGHRSYERLLYSNHIYRSCLETIFGTASVLFIGFGASDPDLEGIISRVAMFDGRSKRHWIVLPQGQFPSLKAERLWKDYGINVIQYEVDPTHSGLVHFLRRLATPPVLAPTLADDQSRAKSLERQLTIETLGR